MPPEATATKYVEVPINPAATPVQVPLLGSVLDTQLTPPSVLYAAAVPPVDTATNLPSP